jgi:CheY-like chemotaxis protein
MPLSKKLRILLVEDDVERRDEIASWMPCDVRLIWCQNGEAAVGVLTRSGKHDFAAVMLDNDLDKRPYVATATKLKGVDVARKMTERLSRDTPVLVHSMSVTREDIMKLLRAEAFPVTQLPYCDLTRENLNAWVEEVREDREDRDD